MKYRKKPIVIEAFQLTEHSRWDNADWPQWAHEAWNLNRSAVGSLSPLFLTNPLESSLSIVTLEGTMRVDIGDWIIRGIKGELYPCKPDIFAATYEPVD